MLTHALVNVGIMAAAQAPSCENLVVPALHAGLAPFEAISGPH